MNRFAEKNGIVSSIRKNILPLLVMAAVFGFLIFGILKTGEDAGRKEKENLQASLEQSVITCYALEGAYPGSLDYLKEHYGLSWDEDKYLVMFEAVGRNLPPDITVMEKGTA